MGNANWECGKAAPTEKRSVAEIVDDALKANPGDLSLSRLIATIYREQPQWLAAGKQSLSAESANRKADEYIEKSVSAYPNDPEALLARYTYRAAYHLPDAGKDLELAVRLAGDNPRVLLAKANADQTAAQEKVRQDGRIDAALPLLDSAMKYYRQVLALKPSEAHADVAGGKSPKDRSKRDATVQRPQENSREFQQLAYANLGVILQIRGATDDAIKTWKEGLAKIPHSVPLNLLLAEALVAEDRTAEAARTDQAKGQDGPIDMLETLVTGLLSAERNASAEAQDMNYRSQVNALRQTVRLLRGRWFYQRGELQAALPILEEVAHGEHGSRQQNNELFQASFSWVIFMPAGIGATSR